jgi:proprotein convertase subtilisin/kexin type 5
VTIYTQKCAAYCTACPDGGSIQVSGSTQCTSTCPLGQIPSTDGLQCLPCTAPCVECTGTPTNCTKCGTISSTQYFLNDTTPTDPATGGVCVTRCLSNLYENTLNSVCTLCDAMCLSCMNTASNCSSCRVVSGTNYFLQPSGLLCLSTCPVGFYGNSSTFRCMPCDSRCSACTGPTNGSCSACKIDSSEVAHFLVPGTRSCSNVCADSLYANSTTFRCELCDSSCLKCFNTSTNCTLCKLIT